VAFKVTAFFMHKNQLQGNPPRVTVIGAGIAGMTAAIELASKGISVDVYEKNDSPGGRGRLFRQDGFNFDMGPSWYWMPEVFENFFNKHGEKLDHYFKLIRLDPSYRIFFANDIIDSPADVKGVYEIFEKIEPGSSQFLRAFLAQSKIKYEAGMNDFVRRPALSIFEFAEWRLMKNLFKLDLFKSIERLIDHNIRDERLRAWLKFPVLFLGAKPSQTPALYSLMNYADFELGTWYPEGGMWKLFDAFYQLALKRGVRFHFNEEVLSINVNDSLATSLKTKNGNNEFDYLIGAADYHHIDTVLLPEGFQQYSDIYWSKRKLAPSALIFYLGIKGRLKDLLHHNLFFDEEFEQHAVDIYDKKVWPAKPLFYVSVTSRSDDSVAPEGHENVFILIPLATGIADDDTQREELLNMVLKRIENKTGCRLAEDIVFRRDYCLRDFVNDYHSFQGNAYGLSNTLDQTAILKPSVKHNKIRNLYFAGQLTHPGPGLPPSLISGETAANLVLKKILRGSH